MCPAGEPGNDSQSYDKRKDTSRNRKAAAQTDNGHQNLSN